MGFFVYLGEEEKSRKAMATVPKSVRKQAEVLRKAGNAAFKKERFGAAIDAYTEVRDHISGRNLGSLMFVVLSLSLPFLFFEKFPHFFWVI